MSRHLDGSLQAVNTIWYRHDEWIQIGCACRYRVALNIGSLARQHQIAHTKRLYQVVERLRCSLCEATPSNIEVRGCPR